MAEAGKSQCCCQAGGACHKDAMRSILALAILLALSVPAGAAEKACTTATKTEFIDDVSKLNITIYKATPRGLSIMLTKVNKFRAQSKQFLLEADEFYIGKFITEQGVAMVGLVMFKNDCVVLGTVTSMTIEQWNVFLKEMEMSEDDFVPVKEKTI